MNRSEMKSLRQDILKKQITDERLQIAIDYLNTKYMPSEIGITYNTSYEYEKFKVGGWLFNKKYIHLVFRHSTVDSIVGSGMDSRRTSKTYPDHVYAFETEEEAKLFSDYSNILVNRDSFKTYMEHSYEEA